MPRQSNKPEKPEGFYSLRRVVAANLRQQRQRRGWPLRRVAADLAPYLGEMGASTISAWESSRQDGAKAFTIEEVYALSRVFDISLSEILSPPNLLDMPPVQMLPGGEDGSDLFLFLTPSLFSIASIEDAYRGGDNAIGS